MMSRSSISKAELLMSPEPVDCSWCAIEQCAPVTDSPTICQHHTDLLLQQSAARQQVKITPQPHEPLHTFVGRKLFQEKRGR